MKLHGVWFAHPHCLVGLLIGTIAVGLALLSCRARPLEIIVASTTSTDDSGLLEYLVPHFREAHPEYRLRVITIGSGEALRLSARGDADVALVHSPQAEEEFMAAGYGESRRRVMFNDFVLVGPESDEAGICGALVPSAAMACIAESGVPFVSRGDDSGTHARERLLWDAAGLQPEGDWYHEAGQGQGAVLMMASEKAAYTLSDRGTFLSLRDRLDLRIIVEGDPVLRNQYSVIVVSDAENQQGARAFADWITSAATQRIIGEFGVERFGRPLFIPNAGP
jgi:tungstate transport system substrate-binding protein